MHAAGFGRNGRIQHAKASYARGAPPEDGIFVLKAVFLSFCLSISGNLCKRPAAMTLFQQSCQRLWKPFTFLCIIAFLYSHRFYGSTSPDPTADMDATYLSLSSLSSTSPQKHPIEFLVEHARRKATDIVERQSKSLQQAMANYRSRYYREPPPGFEDWYRVAVELNATILLRPCSSRIGASLPASCVKEYETS